MQSRVWLDERKLVTQQMRLTLVSPGIIKVVEYRNQNIQYITTLQDKKQEFLSWEYKRDCAQ